MPETTTALAVPASRHGKIEVASPSPKSSDTMGRVSVCTNSLPSASRMQACSESERASNTSCQVVSASISRLSAAGISPSAEVGVGVEVGVVVVSGRLVGIGVDVDVGIGVAVGLGSSEHPVSATAKSTAPTPNRAIVMIFDIVDS